MDEASHDPDEQARPPDPADGDPGVPADAAASHVDGVEDEPADAADPRYRPPPPGHTVRRPADADLPAIAALYERAATRSEAGTTGRGALRTETDLRRTWAARRNDALLVERDGAPVGYLEFHEELDPWTPELDLYAEGRVDPAARGAGVGAFLLDRAQDRALRAAAANPGVPTALRTVLVDPEPATLAWHERRGFTVQRHLLQLRIDLAPSVPEPVWPPGTTGRAADRVSVAQVHDALVASFADHHLGVTDDRATWQRVVLDRGRARLAASVVALDEDGEVVGLALGRAGDDEDPALGVITDLGVVPAWRGRGLATAVLRAAFARFAELGADRVGLEVDDVTLDGALRLYERAGMEVVHHTVVLTTGVLGDERPPDAGA